MNYNEAIHEIKTLVREKWYIYVALYISFKDFHWLVKALSDDSFAKQNVLNTSEISMLFGFLFQNDMNLDYPKSVEKFNEMVSKTYFLFENLHNLFMFREGNEEWDPGKILSEGIIYAWDWSYDVQYMDLLKEKYALDKDYLLEEHWFDTETISSKWKDLRMYFEDKINSNRPKGIWQPIYDYLYNSFTITKDEITKIGLDSLLPNFVLENNNELYNDFWDYNEFISKPIIQVNEDTYIIPIIFLLFESIYESPFYWMTHDKKYEKTYLKNRGQTSENMVYNSLIRAFWEDNIYKNIEIKSSKSTTNNEIDILVIIWNKAICFQIKSKKLSLRAQAWEYNKIISDFTDGIQAAYHQWIESRKEILAKDADFYIWNDKVDLHEEIDECYIIAITSENYKWLSIQSYMLLEQEWDNPFPLILSLFDLETILYYLNDKYDFLYYVRQRTIFYKNFMADTEISLLAYHLLSKLWLEDNNDIEVVDSSYASLIDDHYYRKLMWYPLEENDKIETRWKNDKFNNLLSNVKQINIPQTTDIIMNLMDLSWDTIDSLIDHMEKITKKTNIDNKNHDIWMPIGNFWISFMSTSSNDMNELREKLNLWCRKRKYLSQADSWVWFWKLRSYSDRLFDTVTFSTSKWEYNKDEDELYKWLPTPELINAHTWKKVFRKSQCPCWSGKKYKRCCWK